MHKNGCVDLTHFHSHSLSSTVSNCIWRSVTVSAASSLFLRSLVTYGSQRNRYPRQSTPGPIASVSLPTRALDHHHLSHLESRYLLHHRSAAAKGVHCHSRTQRTSWHPASILDKERRPSQLLIPPPIDFDKRTERSDPLPPVFLSLHTLSNYSALNPRRGSCSPPWETLSLSTSSKNVVRLPRSLTSSLTLSTALTRSFR